MENLSHATFPKTLYGYMELLADHVRENNASSPWPGDSELLAAYNVTPADILESIQKKITEANIQDRIEGAFEVPLSNHYKITADVTVLSQTDDTFCPHCKVALLYKKYFKISNLKNSIEITIPIYALHLLEHNDLGDKAGLNIDPTIACKTLELGNTELQTNNPLYNLAQYGKDFFIKQARNG